MGSNRSCSSPEKDKKRKISHVGGTKRQKKNVKKKSVQVIEQLQFAGSGGKMKIVRQSFHPLFPIPFSPPL